MKKEYDLINELGPMNWLDMVAGEAVVLGHCLNDPCLVTEGTKLAILIKEIHFDDDGFGKVEAFAESLEKELLNRKEYEKTTVFIDELYSGSEKNKSLNEWEFDFNCVNGIYQILMFLPEYYYKEKLGEKAKVKAQEEIQKVFGISSLDCLRKEIDRSICGSQYFETTTYFDKNNKKVCVTIDFNHEGSTKRGWSEFYYFEDFATASKAWLGVREAFISDQKK